jgi:NADH-quinone oxidoreductase subunit N
MTSAFSFLPADLASISAELQLCLAGILLLLLDTFLPSLRRAFGPLALASVAFASYQVWTTQPAGAVFGGLLESTPLTLVASQVVLVAAFLSLLAADGYLRRESILSGEYHALFLWCVVGVLLLVRATELLTIFLALELLSIGLYALAAYHRRLSIAAESALKYFVMGAFVSAFLLYGIAILYGETGRVLGTQSELLPTSLAAVAQALATGETSHLLTSLGLLLVVCGFAFKLSLVPFHAWSPDAYQGAPSPFVAFLSVAPKAGAAVVLLRVVELIPSAGAERWSSLFALLAVLSMLGGNLLALVQRDIKRMLAYSGIAHMGYLMIPLAAQGDTAAPPVLLYLLAYALMNAGAFALVTMLFARAGEQHLVSELSGWGYRFPVLSACLTVCMLSLGGIPPTLGFLGKYRVFEHAIANGRLDLALVGILASLIGVFYYLRVVYVLYMKPELQEPQGLLIDAWGRGAAIVAAGATLALGIWPARLLGWIDGIIRPA